MNFGYSLTADGYTIHHECTYHTSEKHDDTITHHVYPRYHKATSLLDLSLSIDEYVDNDVYCARLTIENLGDKTVRITQADVGFFESCNTMTLHYFRSDWGAEFSPTHKEVYTPFKYGCISGRSCKGYIPYAECETANGFTIMALAWSGNWNCNIEPYSSNTSEKKYLCTMGLSDGKFFFDLVGTSLFTSPAVYLSHGNTREEACLKLRRHFRSHLSLLNQITISKLPVVYNTWWGYEDKEICEEVYTRDAKIAKSIGCDYAMLDAGWFGDSIDGQTWYEKRGDWNNVNQQLFPSGLKALCDNAKALEIEPGIWCEIEAVGQNAKLNQTHDELIAKRDGHSLGYICLGSKDGRQWAMQVIDRILGEYGAKWIKLDFNLDPGYGCNRTDHNHAEGDGLYAHYMGYYQILDEIRTKYPNVIIENCSSGGLRNDIEMLSHTHFSFLADPDYTEFHLQLFWGALSYLHQSSLYHFSWSDTTYCDHNLIRHPITEQTPMAKVDYILRAAMMGVLGLSYRLADLPSWASERIAKHCSFYKTYSSDFIINGDAYRLTPQPLTNGRGERFPVFEFVSADQRAIVFFFRLQGANEYQHVYLHGLIPNRTYSVRYLDTEKCFTCTGTSLMIDGLNATCLCEEGSEVVIIE